MKKTIKYILLFVVATGLTLVGIKAYRMYLTMGLGKVYLDGKNDSIPMSENQIPSITYGESDWLNWRGPDFKGKSSHSGIKKEWSKGLTKLWEAGYLCQGEESVSWASPVIQGNRLVVPGRDEGHDLVFCLQAETGNLIWKAEIKTGSNPSWGTGPRATPSIFENKVYTFGRSGILACFDLFDGSLLWKKNVMDEGGKLPEWGHTSSPTIFENMVIVQGGGSANLIAFDKDDGKVIWRTPGNEAGYAPVVPVDLSDKTILLQFHGTGLSGIDPKDGKELWLAPWETDYFINVNTPIVKQDTVFITSAYKMGAQVLKVSDSGYSIVWKNKTIASQLSDQILVDGFLFGYTANGNNRGPFKCVNFSTGEEIWSTKEIGGGSITYADGHFIALDVKGNLYLLKPDSKRFIKAGEFLSAIPDVSESSWVPPVVANGRLYLRYMHRLICYDLQPQ